MAGLTGTSGPAHVSVVFSLGELPRGAAPLLLEAEIARVCGIPEDDVRVERLCPWCGSADHGRPIVVRRDGLAVPFVSLSRADGVAVAAVSYAGPVGVDVERSDAARFAGFDATALHPEEHCADDAARARTWTRKESLLKATGDGLRVDPRQLRLSDAAEAPRVLAWVGRSAPPVAQLHDLAIDGCVACVTVLADAPVEVTTRQAAPGARPA